MRTRTSNPRTTAGKASLSFGIAAVVAVTTGCSETGGIDEETAAGSSRLEALQEQGSITIGFAGEVPYAFQEDGELRGQAPAVHEAIWSELGIDELDGTQVDFGQLIPGLNAERFDSVAAGMFILPERCAQADFSDPVYVAPNAFLVEAGNPNNVSDFGSIAENDLRLGVLSGAVEGIYAADSGVPQEQIVEVASANDGLAALNAGRIDAFALTSISLNRLVEDTGATGVEVTEAFVPVIDGEEQIGAGAAVFRQEDDELREAFNEQLAALRESGRLLELIEPYGFGPETIPPEDLTTEELCSE